MNWSKTVGTRVLSINGVHLGHIRNTAPKQWFFELYETEDYKVCNGTTTSLRQAKVILESLALRSSWSGRQPVTLENTGSSPVRVAKRDKEV